MTKFAGGSAHSAIDLPIENDPGPHAVGNQHENEVARIPDFGSSEPQLGEGDCIGIIVYRDWQSGRLRNHFAYRVITPLKIRNEDRIASCRSNQPWDTDADSFDRALIRELANNLYNTVQGTFGPGISWEVFLLHDDPGQIATRNSRDGRSDIDANGNSADRAQ